jgi:hypothetical protein
MHVHVIPHVIVRAPVGVGVVVHALVTHNSVIFELSISEDWFLKFASLDFS